jgi:hypothetical protein
MVATPLTDIRAHIESLASESGEYYLVCARTGEQPVPTAGCRFDSREQARAGASATEQYRAVLRKYDERVAHCDIIVCQEGRDDQAIGEPVPEEREGLA